jgi:hypothetical protein
MNRQITEGNPLRFSASLAVKLSAQFGWIATAETLRNAQETQRVTKNSPRTREAAQRFQDTTGMVQKVKLKIQVKA